MDYEKAYKDALERAKKEWKNNLDNAYKNYRERLEIIFPELKESEDEKIRKEIIKLVKFYYGSSLALKHIVSKDEMLAWLEKQEKQSDTNNGLLGKFTDEDYKNMFRSCNLPKFNEGDWIVSDKSYINDDYRLCKIIGINDGCYTIQTINGLSGYNTFDVWENDYRLWTIQDAKDGDILAIEVTKENNPYEKEQKEK